ncbi:MAG: hypothetical protein AAGC46_08600 [Solirubrobacteraceae bacterium]|nr:hypothetical protein [Patulibacter sp.]
MARDRSTRRSFGVIPRTPANIRRADELDLGAVAAQPTSPTGPVAPIVLAHRLTAGIAAVVAVVVAAGAQLAGHVDHRWLPFAVLFAVIAATNARFSGPAAARAPVEFDGAAEMEPFSRTALRAASIPAVVVLSGVAISVVDHSRVYHPFVVGLCAGYAGVRALSAHRLRRFELEHGVEFVGRLPWRYDRSGVDGPLWVRPRGAAVPASGAR